MPKIRLACMYACTVVCTYFGRYVCISCTYVCTSLCMSVCLCVCFFVSFGSTSLLRWPSAHHSRRPATVRATSAAKRSSRRAAATARRLANFSHAVKTKGLREVSKRPFLTNTNLNPLFKTLFISFYIILYPFYIYFMSISSLFGETSGRDFYPPCGNDGLQHCEGH